MNPRPPNVDTVRLRLRNMLGRYGLHAGVALLCLTLSAVLWIGLHAQMNAERKLVVDNKINENDKLAKLLEEHVARTLHGAEVALVDIRSEYQRLGEKFDLVRYVKDRKFFIEPYNSLSITDKNGDQILSSIPIRKPLNFKNSEDFQFHSRNDTQTLFISKPRWGALTGKWTVYLSLRRNNADGSFAGGVTVGMDPSYFSMIFSELNLNKGLRVRVWVNSGHFRAPATCM